eukprot:TRINITY_DN20088_c0_g3_i1.p1 TRINITY_DN20088_c0_g3~~TRINITY_DN20088_c0_g3_i1.p1  ORF type:complete len:168 (+),score=36.33 TRINITY_DN20088_c0_g3_i1:161-664(+)
MPLKTIEFFPRKGIQFNSVAAVLSATEERTPNMTISIGDIVEVSRREAGSFCWLEAKVLSINGFSCEVRYENLSYNDGEPISEVVSSALVRPVPPAMQASGKPKVGDRVEVYEEKRHNHCCFANEAFYHKIAWIISRKKMPSFEFETSFTLGRSRMDLHITDGLLDT